MGEWVGRGMCGDGFFFGGVGGLGGVLDVVVVV